MAGQLTHRLEAAGVDLADLTDEEASARLLEQLYGPSVAEPVRLHVAAKRYLCAVNPAYLDKLSEDSLTSLALQGGPMRAEEVAAFDRLEHRAAALALRIIDDEAKTPGLAPPSLDCYREMARRLEQTA